MKDIYIADLSTLGEKQDLRCVFPGVAQAAANDQNEQAIFEFDPGRQDGADRGPRLGSGDPRIAKDFERGDIVKVRGGVSRFWTIECR